MRLGRVVSNQQAPILTIRDPDGPAAGALQADWFWFHDAKPFSPSIARRRNADALMPSAWALSFSRACSLVESRSSMVVFFVSRFFGFGTVTGQ